MDARGAPRERSILAVSSTVGVHGNAGQANYAAAKAGLIGLAKAVAREWGQFGVRCNAVAFGFIDTRLTKAPERVRIGEEEVRLGIPGGVPAEVIRATVPLRRMGTTADAAGAITLLCSPLAGYITGQVRPRGPRAPPPALGASSAPDPRARTHTDALQSIVGAQVLEVDGGVAM